MEQSRSKQCEKCRKMIKSCLFQNKCNHVLSDLFFIFTWSEQGMWQEEEREWENKRREENRGEWCKDGGEVEKNRERGRITSRDNDGFKLNLSWIFLDSWLIRILIHMSCLHEHTNDKMNPTGGRRILLDDKYVGYSKTICSAALCNSAAFCNKILERNV